ncbi:MAG: peptide chain release factor-like protein [bacterium]|jgi:protein subunit release factor B
MGLSDQELLDHCVVETYGSSGPGGQNVNKRDTAVRLRHKPTGIVVTCQRERSQLRNKQCALEILRQKLRDRNRRKKPRIATKLPRAVKERRLQEKKIHSLKKQKRQNYGEN